jgi:hypothetical protein
LEINKKELMNELKNENSQVHKVYKYERAKIKLESHKTTIDSGLLGNPTTLHKIPKMIYTIKLEDELEYEEVCEN